MIKNNLIKGLANFIPMRGCLPAPGGGTDRGGLGPGQVSAIDPGRICTAQGSMTRSTRAGSKTYGRKIKRAIVTTLRGLRFLAGAGTKLFDGSGFDHPTGTRDERYLFQQYTGSKLRKLLPHVEKKLAPSICKIASGLCLI